MSVGLNYNVWIKVQKNRNVEKKSFKLEKNVTVVIQTIKLLSRKHVGEFHMRLCKSRQG
jgi:hypothetical protein